MFRSHRLSVLTLSAALVVLAACGDPASTQADEPSPSSAAASPSTSSAPTTSSTTPTTAAPEPTSSTTTPASTSTTEPASGPSGIASGAKGVVSYAAMRGDVLEAWGNGGKVLEAAVCDTPRCSIHAVDATLTDLYVALGTVNEAGTEMTSEIRRYPLVGGRAETTYTANVMNVFSMRVAADGTVLVTESTEQPDRVRLLRLQGGAVDTLAEGNIQGLDMTFDGKSAFYTTTEYPDPSQVDVTLWKLDAEGQTTAVATQLAYPGVTVANDGRSVLYPKRNPTGATRLIEQSLASGESATMSGEWGCFTSGETITWGWGAESMTAHRGEAQQIMPRVTSGDIACRPDGALVVIGEPKATAAANDGIADDGGDGSYEHVCSVGNPEGDLTVVRADGTTTRLGVGYHRVFQL